MLRLLSRVQIKVSASRLPASFARRFHDEFGSSGPTNGKTDEKTKHLKPLQKFQIFQDTDAQIILDVEEERKHLQDSVFEVLPLTDPEVNLERGLTGVFEIDELVKLLKKDNAINVCVCQVPKELSYVDYICCVTGRNSRHMLGMAEYVRKVFKLKRHKDDTIPKIEGAASNEWIALDLGNIALHIFSASARQRYDIEQLWALGSQYDSETNKIDESLVKLEKYSIYLEDLKPRSDT